MQDIKFEDIQRANEKIKTTSIKGKDYAEVNQRIKAFRMVYPTGFIIPEMKSNKNGICIFEASVGYYNEGEPFTIGHGTAYEKEGSSFINNTSYIENCETSAVGRALGMAGFGIDTSVRSAEEMQNAELQQEDIKPITNAKVTVLQKLIKDLPDSKKFYENILKKYNIKDLSQLTSRQYGETLLDMKKLKGE